MDLSSLIFVALFVAWAVYLIPMALRRHEEDASSRSVDGFSERLRVLARRDPALRAMVRHHGVPPIVPGRRGSHFATLARAVCFQQLAGRAAATIHGRFEALFDGPPTARGVLALPPGALRSAGLSGAKAASITDLAERVETGTLRLHGIGRLPDDEVVTALTAVRGIGEWTAQMFLMFRLGRLDVWPVLDLGVRVGHARLFDLPAPLAPRDLSAAGEPFRPYRSLVAW